MAGPYLPNLTHLRIVNVELRSVDLISVTQAFFTLHYMPEEVNEALVKPKTDDVFTQGPFSKQTSNLLYVSETISVNSVLNFGVITLPSMPQRSFRASVELWVSTREECTRFRRLYCLKIDLRNLVLLSKEACEKYGVAAFTENAVVWSFDNNDYCLRAHLKDAYAERVIATRKFIAPTQQRKQGRLSYSLDDMRHMSSLIVGLRDFHESKTKISVDIDLHISRFTSLNDELRRLMHSLTELDNLISRQETANETLESQIFSTRSCVKKMAQLFDSDFPSYRTLLEEKLSIVFSQVAPLRESLENSIYPHVLSSTHRIVSEVMEAFPIKLVEGSAHYSISGIEFPSSITEILNTCYNEEPRLQDAALYSALDSATHTYLSLVDCINAGLSEIVAVLNSLSFIMGVSVKYKMTYAGSRSFLIEHLSPQQVVANNEKVPASMNVSTIVTYPLFYDDGQSENFHSGIILADGKKHPRNVRFERGLTLLNRNLSFFISDVADLYSEYHGDIDSGNSIKRNIPSECVDHFLGNLHYLMLFITEPSQCTLAN